MKIQGRNFKDFFSKPNDTAYLKGKLLLSMPQMSDTRFHRAVILVCAHDAKGAMGIMINKKMPELSLEDLCEQMDFSWNENDAEFSIYNGGPVETGRGFILHSTDFKQDETVEVTDSFAVTGTVDALKGIIKEIEKPQHMIFALGYTGWSEGQLDQELTQNSWLVAQATQDLVFNTPISQIWDKAVESLGVNPAMLSSQSGRA